MDKAKLMAKFDPHLKPRMLQLDEAIKAAKLIVQTCRPSRERLQAEECLHAALVWGGKALRKVVDDGAAS